MPEDFRRAFRLLAQAPGFSLLAIATLALGIAANTAIFSVVQGVLLRPLEFDHPERIVALQTEFLDRARRIPRVSGGDYVDLRGQADQLESISRYWGGEIGVQLPGRAEFTGVYFVNRGYFDALGLRPAYGRLFADSEEQRAAVVSLAFANRNFGGAAAALGQLLRVDSRAYEVTGVLPDHVPYPRQADVWLAALYRPENLNRTAYNYRAIARLKPGATLASAEAQMAAISAGVKEDKKLFHVVSLQDELVRGVRPTLYLLMGAVALVLLISCSNVANLMLARAAGRAREIGVRCALGASRPRIVRQLFVEGLVLALVAGAAGAALAFWATDALIAFAPPDLPRIHDVRVDWTMLAIAIGVSLLAAVLFALAPAWQASKVDVQEALRQGGGASRGSVGANRHRLRSGLLVAQVALAFVLASGAGLLFRSFVAMLNAELGYRKDNVLVMYAHKPANRMPEMVEATRRFEELYGQLRALPGVRSVAGTMGLPSGVYGSNGFYEVEGHLPFKGGPEAGFRLTSPGLFATLGVPILQGRDFTARDQYDAPFVAIVNRALVRQTFPHENPIGKRIRCGLDSPNWMTVVGVVGDIRHDSPGKPPAPELYMPLAQHPPYANEVQVAIATTGEPAALASAVRETVRRFDPSIATRFETLDAMVAGSIAAPRFRTFLISLFALVAVGLAMAGIYGVMTYLVAQRTAELGLRLALGATPGGLVATVLGRAMSLVAVGVILGIGGAFASARAAAGISADLAKLDPAILVAVTLATLAVSALAAAAPALRAGRVDPMTALREE